MSGTLGGTLRGGMAIKQLTALGVQNLSEPGRYADGNGLYLNISNNGNKSWLFRYQLDGKRHWVGFGAFDKKTNSLAMARDKVAEARLLLNRGVDPQNSKREQKRERLEKQRQLELEAKQNKMTFRVCAENYIEIMKAQWTNKKHIQQWTNTLDRYAYPIIGNMPVRDINIEHVRKCLDPIWNTKTETATRVRQRIEAVLGFAIAHEYRVASNPAIWKGLLDNFYPNPNKIKQNRYEAEGKKKHHNALPYQELPAFMTELQTMEGIAAKALQFTILTASRTSEVRLAVWDEIDFSNKVWNVPAHRMKARKDHRVALSEQAIQILEGLPKINEYLFPGMKQGQPICDGAMTSVLKRMGKADITVHGMRSTFRDYIGEETGFPHRLAEFALAHGLTDEAEKAYARGDLLKKRFKMMNAWSGYAFSTARQNKVAYIKKTA